MLTCLINNNNNLYKDVEITFKNYCFTNNDNAIKVALVLYIEIVMMGKDNKTRFDMKMFGIVDDIEVFKSYMTSLLHYFIFY